jgi:hypothetical protein
MTREAMGDGLTVAPKAHEERIQAILAGRQSEPDGGYLFTHTWPAPGRSLRPPG